VSSAVGNLPDNSGAQSYGLFPTVGQGLDDYKASISTLASILSAH